MIEIQRKGTGKIELYKRRTGKMETQRGGLTR